MRVTYPSKAESESDISVRSREPFVAESESDIRSKQRARAPYPFKPESEGDISTLTKANLQLVIACPDPI